MAQHFRAASSQVIGLILLLGLVPATQAAAQFMGEPTDQARPKSSNQWRTEHTVLAIASSVTITTDWLLSANAARRGTFDEMNPILGHHPSVGQLNTYNLLILGSNLAIGRLLPNKFRTLWFTAITSFETAIVLHQYNIGLHIDLLQM